MHSSQLNVIKKMSSIEKADRVEERFIQHTPAMWFYIYICGWITHYQLILDNGKEIKRHINYIQFIRVINLDIKGDKRISTIVE